MKSISLKAFVMLVGIFNLTVESKNLKDFRNTFDLECLIKKPTCFQSASRNWIDLIWLNKKKLFKFSNVLEVRITDHYGLVVTELWSLLVKRNSKT